MDEGLKGCRLPALTMSSLSRVFVPSVTEENGNTIGLGIFSTEEVAWKVLRTFLKKLALSIICMEIHFSKLTAT